MPRYVLDSRVGDLYQAGPRKAPEGPPLRGGRGRRQDIGTDSGLWGRGRAVIDGRCCPKGVGMRWRILPLLMGFVALAHFNRISMSVAGAEQVIRPGFISEAEMGL